MSREDAPFSRSGCVSIVARTACCWKQSHDAMISLSETGRQQLHQLQRSWLAVPAWRYHHVTPSFKIPISQCVPGRAELQLLHSTRTSQLCWNFSVTLAWHIKHGTLGMDWSLLSVFLRLCSPVTLQCFIPSGFVLMQVTPWHQTVGKKKEFPSELILKPQRF